jgi:hypothetical protein
LNEYEITKKKVHLANVNKGDWLGQILTKSGKKRCEQKVNFKNNPDKYHNYNKTDE